MRCDTGRIVKCLTAPRSGSARIAALSAAAFGFSAVLALLSGSARPAAAADFDSTTTFTAHDLTVTDLIGAITIEGSDSANFEVEVKVHGKDATRDLVKIQSKQGDNAELDVLFPVKEDSRFVYPPLGDQSSTTVTVSRHGRDADNPLDAVLRSLGGRRIKVSGDGRGLEMWADVTVRVPRDRRLFLDLCVGSIEATRVASRLELNTQSGPVRTAGVTGDLTVETGSGDVIVEGSQGDALRLDTGSGSVKMSAIGCKRLHVETGSGRVDAKGVTTDDLKLETGSGSIALACDHVGSGPYHIETGSGSIELSLPGDTSADVAAETGSGQIEVDVGKVQVLSREDDSVSFRMGKGGADIKLETGSGSISITH